MQAALRLISGDLYQNSMHFLLELLQNSDDSEYLDSEPMMRITYQDRTIRFDTNEVGFRRRDIEAICSVGNSFKKELGQQKRRIGEKGIGFKSVFGVSKEVFINSGYYSFKFTTEEPLGMLAPICASFPGNILTGHTSIFLHLQPHIDVDELVEELKKLDGRILMFLQNLKRVVIKIVEADGSATETVLQQKTNYLPLSGGEICTVKPDTLSPYLIYRHIVSDLPAEQRRGDGNESEIVLAFPFGFRAGTSSVTLNKPNHVYSFLPIRDYGFKFVLHADFILVSSREEIDPESEWNKSLRNHIPSAFRHSVARLQDSSLRYVWPCYIPLRPKIENFFRGVWLEILKLLSQDPILESAHGTFLVPAALCLVPKEFCGLNNQPLIPADSSEFTYISPRYPFETWGALKSLGVRILSAHDFLDTLSSFIVRWPDKFQSMPAEWHSCLARALDPLVMDHEERIMALPFVRLRDGTLTSPGSGLLFTVTSDNMAIPEDIHASVVHIDAVGDHPCRILLQKLGAQVPDKAAVCRIILETHKSEGFNPKVAQIPNLIKQVEFLHKAGWNSESLEDTIWVVAEDGSRHHGCNLYLGSDDPYSAKQILSRCQGDISILNHFTFLHPGYSSSFTELEDKKWLQKFLGVSEVPRLVQKPQGFVTYVVDPGIKLLPNQLDAGDLLQMLRANWTYYCRWIVPETSQDADIKVQLNAATSIINNSSTRPSDLYTINEEEVPLRKELTRLFSDMTVTCLDGFAKLRQTCLPRRSVLLDLNVSSSKKKGRVSPSGRELSGATELWQTANPAKRAHLEESASLFPVLEIPEPEDPAWDFLKHFGVIVKVTAKELIARLESLRERPIPSRISRIYEQIQACASDDDKDFLQRKFKNDKLVYIPEECAMPLQGSRWISLDACVWDGPTCLKKFLRLKDFYPRLEDLFCSKLKLAIANLNTLVAEAILISSVDSLAYIRSLFKQLSHMSYGTYEYTRQDAKFYDLLKFKVVPIWKGKRGAQFDCLSSSEMVWYIADTPYLLDSFEGKVPILAFEPSILGDIKDLITYLGWEHRKLRTLAKRESSITGFERVDYNYTQSLRGKWRCISRLIPISKPDRVNLVRQLHSVQVLEAEGIHISWKVTNVSGKACLGNPEKGRVMLAPGSEVLKIYMTKEDMTVGCPPFELIDELTAFCGIEINEHIRLLGHILVQSNIGRIETDLDRSNVPYLGIEPNWSSPNISHGSDQAGVMQQISQTVPEAPTAMGPRASTDNRSAIDINLAALKPSLVPLIAEDSLLSLDTKPEFESTSALPVLSTQPKSGRQKLEDGWRSKVYGNKAVSEENITKPPKERRVSKLETSDMKRPKTTAKKVSSLESTENYRGKNVADITESTARLAARSRRLGRSRRYDNDSIGLVSLSMPILAASRFRQIEDIRFRAELYVAEALAEVMGSDFDQQRHWTSYLRSRAGHKPHDPEDSGVSTFTVSDTNGRLSKFLAARGYASETSLAHEPIFHIQVVHSIGPVGSTFNISSDQVEKARLLSNFTGTVSKRKEGFVLAYAYDIFSGPKVALYPNPWDLHVNGLLTLEAYHDQEGRLDDTAPAVHVQSAVPMAHDGSFKYQHLKPREIRILDLSPGEHDEPLKGVIRHTPIADVGTFCAISYVWGEYLSDTSPYCLSTPQGIVPLNFSLYSALRAIRKDSIISIWADSICINQKDSREKALQISMLGKIFQAAEHVTAWLGHAYNGSEDAIRALSQIRPKSRNFSLEGDTTSSTTEIFEGLMCRVPDPGDVTWKHINSLLRRPWFARVWITQELVLPRKVVLLCGQSELDWDQFFEALSICEGQSNRVSRQSSEDIRLLPDAGPAYALGLARNKQKKEGKRFGLLEWFEIFEHAEASIEVDKLFAFLSLAYDGINEEFMPDYESSLQEVVRRYSKGFIRRGQVMELLYRAGGSKSYEFCSWIPRWTEGQFPKTISTWDAHNGPFRAGVPSAPVVSTSGERIPQCLVVKGYAIDVIVSAHPIKWGSGSSLFFFDTMVNFKRLLSHVNDYPTGEHTEDLLLKLPIGDAARPHLESDIDKERSYRAFAAQRDNEWPPNMRESILSVDYDEDPSKYLHMSRETQVVVAQYWQTAVAFSRRLGNASFCFTNGRYVGLVPEATVAGDQICLLYGGTVPFVVRKHGPTYTFVGECYIHGIMNGQAPEQPRLEQSFTLV
ncbi:hypothetical protein GGS24DRAFT_129333 [Hypoxylon argillaceum]|nr:hypothetical protein GGS24DRAFT_129333 [Hypoxylon argillaceum]